MREVAARDDQVGFDRLDGAAQRVDRRRVRAPEVRVGDEGERRRYWLAVARLSPTFSRMKSMIACVGAPGVKTSATPSSLSSGMSWLGIVPPTDDDDVPGVLLLEQLDHLRHERHVRAGQDRQADRVGVLLQRGLDDLLGGLVQAGVDDLHACIAQGAGDDLRPAVVAVEPGLGDDDADLPLLGHLQVIT